MSTGSKLSGQIVDRESKKGVGDALVIVLKPGIRTAEFVERQQRDMALTSTRTQRDGRFELPDLLPAGHLYSLIVVARGYADQILEEAVRIAPNARPETKLTPIRLDRD